MYNTNRFLKTYKLPESCDIAALTCNGIDVDYYGACIQLGDGIHTIFYDDGRKFECEPYMYVEGVDEDGTSYLINLECSDPQKDALINVFEGAISKTYVP